MCRRNSQKHDCSTDGETTHGIDDILEKGWDVLLHFIVGMGGLQVIRRSSVHVAGMFPLGKPESNSILRSAEGRWVSRLLRGVFQSTAEVAVSRFLFASDNVSGVWGGGYAKAGTVQATVAEIQIRTMVAFVDSN